MTLIYSKTYTIKIETKTLIYRNLNKKNHLKLGKINNFDKRLMYSLTNEIRRIQPLEFNTIYIKIII